MISCYLTGGLGNQLFQIFATIAYCIQHRKQFVFPYKKTYIVEQNRPEYWDNFLLALRSSTTRVLPFSIDEILKYPKYAEPHHTYDPIPDNLEDNVTLKGFFQSYKYFDTYIDQIKDIIGFNVMYESVMQKYKLIDKSTHSISVHFRMGDYKKLQCYHPIMPWGYYKQSLEHIVKTRNVETVNVYLFFENEDESLVDAYISKITIPGVAIQYVKMPSNIVDWEQMILMSACNDHVIANSTFSWWGAYFNPSSSKMVCYPDAWYGHQLYYIQTGDMFPSSWTRIQINRGLYPIPCNCNK
jgi:hypothetical protein